MKEQIRTSQELESKVFELEAKLAAKERELHCISELSNIAETHKYVDDILFEFLQVLKKSWQFPDITGVKITNKDYTYQTENFRKTKWGIDADIIVEGKTEGKISIVYLENKTKNPDPFLKEEYELLHLISERVGKVIERLEKNKRCTELFDTLFESIIKADKNGIITEANQEAANLCGCNSPKTLIGKPVDSLYADPEKRKELIERLKREGGDSHNTELLLKRKDETTIPVLCNIRMLYNRKGEYVGTLGALRDVSEIKETENALKESEAQKNAILNGISAKIGFVDTDLRFIWANNASAIAANTTSEEMIGHHCYALWANPNKVCKGCPAKKAIQTGQKSRCVITTPDGKIWDASGDPVFDDKGNVIGVVEIAQDITAQKKAEQALKESEEKYKNIANKSTDVIWTQDLSFNLNYMSQSVERLLGYTVEEYISLPLEQRLPEVSIAVATKELTENLQKVRSGEVDVETHTFIFEMLHKHKNGELAWGEVNCSFLHDGEKNITGVHGITRNINERKCLDQALKESEEKLKEKNRVFNTLLENLSQGVFMVEAPTGKPILINKAAYEMLGRGIKPDINKKNLQEVYKAYKENTHQAYPPEEMPIIRGMYGEASHIDDMVIETESGIKRNLEVFGCPVYNDKGEVWASIASFVDITARKELEQTLSNSLINLQMAQSIAHLGNWQFDPRIGVPVWSAEIYEIFERDPELGPMIPNELPQIYGGEEFEKFSIIFRKAVNEGKAYDYTLRLNFPGNIIKWVRAICQPQHKVGDVGYFLRGTFQDITILKKAEEALKENEKILVSRNEFIINQNATLSKLIRDKDKFMSILAHDLKSPFSSLLGFLQIMRNNIRDYTIDEIEEYVNIIADVANKSYQLVEDLLLWSRAQSGKIASKPNNFKLGEICQSMVEETKTRAPAKEITVYSDISVELVVFADVNMLKTILRNLLSNALKFTNTGGRIILKAKESDSNVTISVADTGVGIAKEKLSDLFNIAIDSTTKGTYNEEGTGLGLQICKEFVEKMGGTIWAESEVNKGTVFYFTIPKQQKSLHGDAKPGGRF